MELTIQIYYKEGRGYISVKLMIPGNWQIKASLFQALDFDSIITRP
jgi:ABC-type uncharacterized transport system permease subunit